MPRIKKRGLSYYPLDADFLQKRSIRRILKREGDSAIAALLSLFSAIYTGEGYYVQADRTLCEDLADTLYTLEAEDIGRILKLAVDCGVFDERLYREAGILTSRDIQLQYLFAKRGARRTDIDPRYNLLPPEEQPEDESCPAGDNAAESCPAPAPAAEPRPAGDNNAAPRTAPAPAAESRPAGNAEEETAAEMPITATKKAINGEKTYPGTHSIVKHSIEKHSKEKPLLTGSPGGTEDAGRQPAEGTSCRWTPSEIAALQPPADGLPRNLDGLRLNLMLHRVPPQEQYAIILKSNYGIIGHPVWQGFGTLRESHGKIRQPGRYLLSLCTARKKGQ